MQLLAATAPAQPSPFQQAPIQQAPQYQPTTMQPDRPVSRPSALAKVINNTLFFFNIAVIIFFVVMAYRFVRATEKIAESVKGNAGRKEETPTQSQS